MKRARPRRETAAQTQPAVTSALSKPLSPERLRGLLRQQRALLAKIKQEQKQRDRLAESARESMSTVMSELQPLFAQRDQLAAAIQRVFSELLVEGRLPKRSRRQVEQVYASLNEVLDSGLDDTHEEQGGAQAGEEARHAASAHVGREAGKESMRDVFRRLVLALHPDRAVDEQDRRQRTEVMKRVTQAYETGDLAALLEAERQWLAGARETAAAVDFDAQCRLLERAVAELKEQLSRLRAEVKELKRSPPLEMARAMKRHERGEAADPLVEAVEEAEEELEQLRDLLGFVTAFRDKKISLAEFLRGPPSARDELSNLDDMLLAFLEEEEFEGRKPGARSRRRTPF